MADWYDRIRGNYQGAMSAPQTDGVTRLLALMMGGANKPKPAAPNYSAIPLNPFDIPYTGPKNEMNPPLPAFEPPGTTAQAYMPPMTAKPMVSPQAASVYGGASAPAPMPTMPPVEVSAPAMPDPRTMGDADMAGYGGSPRIPGIAAPQPYSHLNPTPSLEEIFRREYAANPAAFGGKFG